MGDCALTELKWAYLRQVAAFLDDSGKLNQLMQKITTADSLITYSDLESIASSSRPSDNLLLELASKGYTKKQLTKLLDACFLTEPQLILRRNFVAVRLTEPLTVVNNENCTVVLKCKAVGFPYPQYVWTRDAVELDGATSNTYVLKRCSVCTLSGTYCCVIRNEVWDTGVWSKFYRQNGRQYESCISTEQYVFENKDALLCESCSRQKVNDKLAQALSQSTVFSPPQTPSPNSLNLNDTLDDNEQLYAVDKVALLISNSEYANLPRLITPPCDAEVLADGLLTLGFKTVTMADLGLNDMQRIVQHYVQLMAEGVYAVFYFVGHGFEAQGQCYLIPVDAPGSAYNPGDCICVEWLLSLMQQKNPGLNTVLLDMCRKCPPANPENFEFLQQHEYPINRNLVFGYATSRDIGAYEVRGETNGIFMKYLKSHMGKSKPIVDVLRLVHRDLEKDPSAAHLQCPEIRTMLSKQRSWTDPIDPSGHSTTFDFRTLQWQRIHELPDPVHVSFDSPPVTVTVWFDFCGPYSNMIYVFTSVVDSAQAQGSSTGKQLVAVLDVPQRIESVHHTICTEIDEGVSVRSLLKQLHKIEGALSVTVQLRHNLESTSAVISQKSAELGQILVSRLNSI